MGGEPPPLWWLGGWPVRGRGFGYRGRPCRFARGSSRGTAPRPGARRLPSRELQGAVVQAIWIEHEDEAVAVADRCGDRGRGGGLTIGSVQLVARDGPDLNKLVGYESEQAGLRHGDHNGGRQVRIAPRYAQAGSEVHHRHDSAAEVENPVHPRRRLRERGDGDHSHHLHDLMDGKRVFAGLHLEDQHMAHRGLFRSRTGKGQWRSWWIQQLVQSPVPRPPIRERRTLLASAGEGWLSPVLDRPSFRRDTVGGWSLLLSDK